MKMNDIQRIAKERSIKSGRIKKTELIRLLQQEEGNQCCFMTGIADTCGQDMCSWRDDCY
jgi:hypothetical protein